jgi:NitT/TauT family transport system ATP-binding protein
MQLPHSAAQMRLAASAAVDQPFVRLVDVAKHYRTRGGATLVAIEHYDLEVAEGQFVSVVGPSGCGKSTLLKLVAGLLRPSRGYVELRGTRVTGPQPDVGMVFQSPVLLKWRTVLRNVLLPIQILRRSPTEYEPKARALLQLAGLAEFADHYPWELSGGMQQRVALCRALIHDPSLLLMDEPFGALDEMTREEMNDSLLHIWAATRKTVLFVTHSIAEAVYLSDRVVVVSARPSRVVADLPIALPRPRTPGMRFTAAFNEYVRDVRQHLGLRVS